MLGDVGIGAGQQDPHIGVVRTRAPHLLTVDDPLVPVAIGSGRQAGEIRARTGLAEQLAPDLLSPQHGRKVPGPLSVGAVVRSCVGPAIPMATANRPEVTSKRDLLLAEDHRLDDITSPPAELDRPGDPGPAAVEQSALPGSCPRSRRHRRSRRRSGMPRAARDPSPWRWPSASRDLVPEGRLLRGVVEVHGHSTRQSAAVARTGGRRRRLPAGSPPRGACPPRAHRCRSPRCWTSSGPPRRVRRSRRHRARGRRTPRPGSVG